MKITGIQKKEVWDWEKIWDDYGQMIYKIAHNVMKKYGAMVNAEFEELLAEGFQAIIKKSEKYDPARGKKATWIYTCAYYGMVNFCRRYKHKTNPVNLSIVKSSLLGKGTKHTKYMCPLNMSYLLYRESDPEWEPEAIDKAIWLKNLLEEIGSEASVMIKTIIEAPDELVKMMSPTAPVSSRKAVDNYLVNVLDWSTKDVDRVKKEIVNCL